MEKSWMVLGERVLTRLMLQDLLAGARVDGFEAVESLPATYEQLRIHDRKLAELVLEITYKCICGTPKPSPASESGCWAEILTLIDKRLGYVDDQNCKCGCKRQ